MKTYYHKKILKLAEIFVKKAEEHVEEQVNDYLLTIRENLLLAKKQIQQDSFMEPDLKGSVLRRITLALKDSEECSYDSDSHNWELFRLVNSIVSNLKSITPILSSIKQSVVKTLQDVITAVDGLHNLLSYKSKLDFKNPDELSEENVVPGFFESETDRAVEANDKIEEYYDDLAQKNYALERKQHNNNTHEDRLYDKYMEDHYDKRDDKY